jgi:hypothetical protein
MEVILRTLFYGALVAAVVYYAFFQSRALINGPSIMFTEPQNGTALEESVVTVTGKVERIAFLTLNGRQIFVDGGGVFEEKLILLPGHNIIEVQAVDRFGRTAVETLHLTRTIE